MAKSSKTEEVSVSFHYLTRLKKKNDPSKFVPITMDEFELVFSELSSAKKLDLTDQGILGSVRSKRLAPIDVLERVDSRTICGIFRASSFGHSFDNTIKGNIPANSVNLRPFFFQLYLSQSGRLYIASQYLGLYGGYIQIRNSVLGALSNTSYITSNSFNLAHLDLQNTEIREIQFEFSRKGASSSSGNVFGKYGSLSLKVRDNDEVFEKTIRSKLLSKYPFSKAADVRRALSDLLEKDDLVELNDEDIDACRILVRSNKKDRYIHLIAGMDFASRFPIDVAKKKNGHPVYEPLKAKITHLLKTQILAKKEDV